MEKSQNSINYIAKLACSNFIGTLLLFLSSFLTFATVEELKIINEKDMSEILLLSESHLLSLISSISVSPKETRIFKKSESDR